MSYDIILTADDVRAIEFVGDRYCWSAWASRLKEGRNTLAEHEAWEFKEQIESDTQGEHSPLPMLNESGTLYTALLAFVESVI